jgi:hypothetical protein
VSPMVCPFGFLSNPVSRLYYCETSLIILGGRSLIDFYVPILQSQHDRQTALSLTFYDVTN